VETLQALHRSWTSNKPATLGGTLTGTTTEDEQWFYTQGGQRKGPVPADELRELLATLTIDGETPVWRKGLADWQPLRNTEIAAHLKDTPPAVAANQLNNGLVWALAFAPLVYLFIDVALLNYQNNHPADDEFFETFLSPLIVAILQLEEDLISLLLILEIGRVEGL
jgi:hypothetical protein